MFLPFCSDNTSFIDFLGYETFSVGTRCMRPNILENEHILTKKIRPKEIEVGDVIVFSFSSWTALRFQEEETPDCVLDLDRRYLVKRVVAKANDMIEFESKQIMVNGIPISDEQSDSWELLNNGRQYPFISPVRYRKLMSRIREGHVFVLGDNRAKSADSRCWGEVPVSAIKGRVGRILFSEGQSGIRWSRIGEKVK